MTDEQHPGDPDRPVPDIADDIASSFPLDDAELDLEVAEPHRAVRASPYAIVAFVTAVLSLMPAVQGMFAFPFVVLPFTRGLLLAQLFLAALIPVGAAGLALWFARRGDLEIERSHGRLGGVAFCKAARAIALLATASVVMGIVLQVVARESQVQNDFNPTRTDINDADEIPPPAFPGAPTNQPLPAQPARPR